jgi:hypothetical protein
MAGGTVQADETKCLFHILSFGLSISKRLQSKSGPPRFFFSEYILVLDGQAPCRYVVASLVTKSGEEQLAASNHPAGTRKILTDVFLNICNRSGNVPEAAGYCYWSIV